MKIRQVLAVACAVALAQSGVTAAPIDEAVSQLSSDSTLLSQWMADQLKYVVPFNSTSGNVVPNQLKIFGVEVGGEIVASGTQSDTDALRALPTQVINTQTIDAQGRIPMPLALGHAKVGLPFGFDAGVRFGGIPKTHIDNGDTKSTVSNTVFGIDIRKKIIEEGALKPFGLTLAVNYTHANGSLDTTSPLEAVGTATVDVSGTPTSYTFSGTGSNHADWQTNSYGVQAILDKQILFFTPYIGASANYNTGKINTNLTTTGLVTISGFSPSQETASGSANADANQWDCRALLGAEFTFLPFMKLGIGGEYAGNKNMAASLGLRFQFR
jgi:hypothetical protein